MVTRRHRPVRLPAPARGANFGPLDTFDPGSTMPRPLHLLALAVVLGAASAAGAQQAASPTPASSRPELAVGRQAPDFALPGATRFGLLRDPMRLSDLHGKTIVLALFPKARTKG